MNKLIQYKGTRWFKCDFHLHTPASCCFRDKEVTAQQWVEKAIEKKLDCVAITDHNTGAWIDDIKKAAEGTSLTVFPGVEITCDTSQIHLLILFDTHKTRADVEDFLVQAGIKRDDFGEQNSFTTQSITDIADLARDIGALVVPAHVDEYNGLGSASFRILTEFFSRENINAVQVVHKQFLDDALTINNNEELKVYLNTYYNPKTPIDDSTIKEWTTPIRRAKESNLSILTFSDNPHEQNNSQHGLWGIGNHYTWIKMNETPCLEGLRQAFLLPELRVKNEFDSSNYPYTSPDLWIKSIKIENTTLTGDDNPLQIDFNPQLNTIIGGRGSGKSSILRFIRGVFNRTSDLTEINDVLKDHQEFYKKESGRPKKGVFKDSSKVEIEFVRKNFLNKIIASNITNSDSQEIKIQRFNEETKIWEDVPDEGYIDFFQFEHYSQKQIYEIAQQPNALLNRIDDSIDRLNEIKAEREQVKKQFLEKSAAIRTHDQFISTRGKTETNIKDLNLNIKRLQQSGIAELLASKGKFCNEEIILNNFKLQIDKREKDLQMLFDTFTVDDVNYDLFNEEYKNILGSISKAVIDEIALIKTKLEELTTNVQLIRDNFETSINNSKWKQDFLKNEVDFQTQKIGLENEGLSDISNFEKLTHQKIELEKEIERIDEMVITREKDFSEREELKSKFLELSTSISDKRKSFVNNVLQDGKVKINIKRFRNKNDFEAKIRFILNKENGVFQKEIDELSKLCFTGQIEDGIAKVREVFLKIMRNETVSDIDIQGQFVNMVKKLTDSQRDEIELFIPEDEVEVQYRTTDTSSFKPLATASAGQKTTAILTFILSYGCVPLILDQPEDDLDNRLVYELIVHSLKEAKESRQLIVVTHNANVPVNGDAEYIISMDTNSKTLKVLSTGTVEQGLIKKEICDVMEGGQEAFQMRSRRYK